MRTKKPNKFKMRFLGKRRSAEKGSTGESAVEETKDFVEDNTARIEPEREREREPEPEREREPEPEDVTDTIPELKLADQRCVQLHIRLLDFFCSISFNDGKGVVLN